MESTPPSHSVAVGQARLRSFDLPGPAGRLEALLNEGRADAEYAVLVCHPHPLGGGTMHNKVVYHCMKAFQSLGLPVLRFNFRGTGRSEGMHEGGRGEVSDVHAALDWLEREFHLPLLFAGFSFGANVGLRACCGDPRVKGLVALGLPVRADGRGYSYEFLSGCTQPKLFASGSLDEFGPQSEVEAVVRAAPEPRSLIWIGGADHFFAGHLEDMQIAIRAWVGANFVPSAP
jgi:alpha/beta superfamily hydrolase